MRPPTSFQRWNGKADAYVGALTLLATALFLFGLAQALAGRLRLFLTLAGVLTVGAGLLWTISILALPGGA